MQIQNFKCFDIHLPKKVKLSALKSNDMDFLQYCCIHTKGKSGWDQIFIKQ